MVTLKDIANLCEVSVATVSRALNGQTDINNSTAKRIRKMAQEMGWEYVCRLREIDIYRSEDGLSPELNTDAQLQAKTVEFKERLANGETVEDHEIRSWLEKEEEKLVQV